MSTSTLARVQTERGWNVGSRLVDYLELTKPRIMVMVLVTVVLAGVVATWGQPDLWRLFHTVVGTTLVAASASVFNQWLEQNHDARMRRTQNRPLPTHRLGNSEALTIGVVCGLAGLAYLLNLASRPAACWAAATWLMYVCVYTPLKTRTWLNTLVGAIPGAMPVLIGWTGSGAQVDLRGWSLFLIVFLWQFPHFMAIAWLYRQQYSQAGMRMLTVVDATGRRAGIQAVVAAGSLLVVSLIPVALAPSWSFVYVCGSFVLGVGQLFLAVRFWQDRTDQRARRLLRASLVYLPSQLILVTLLNLVLI